MAFSANAVDLDAVARLVRIPGGGSALLAPITVRLNGVPCLPIQILRDRDEISTPHHLYCFTTATAAAVTFTGGCGKMRCARCLGQLIDGESIVECPRCRAHHHADHWKYGPGCQKCNYPTTGPSWIPEAME